MSYYDHATAMAFKIGRWQEEQTLRNFELEAQAAERRASVVPLQKQSIRMRCLYVFRSHKPKARTDRLKSRNR